jgi:hypothetical protein
MRKVDDSQSFLKIVKQAVDALETPEERQISPVSDDRKGKRGMSEGERQVLGGLIRKYLERELYPGEDGTRLSRKGKTLSWRGIEGERVGRWGVHPSLAARIARGENTIGPDTALRILRDLKPDRADLETFLAVTHLDTLLFELGEILRQAGYSSSLSAATGLVWSNQLKATALLRRVVEVSAIAPAIKVLSKDFENRKKLEDMMNRWEKELRRGEFNKAFKSDQDFHEYIVEFAFEEDGAAVSDEEREGLKDVVQRCMGKFAYAYTDLLETPLMESKENIRLWVGGEGAGAYSEEEEWMIFRLHHEIAKAILDGDRESAQNLMERHFDWLWQDLATG